MHPDGGSEEWEDHLSGLYGRPHEVRVATYAVPDHSLTPSVLDEAEVLVYCEHRAHSYISNKVIDGICPNLYKEGVCPPPRYPLLKAVQMAH